MRLIQDLFARQAYNPLIRPVRNLTGTVHVKFGMAMIQLINVVSIRLAARSCLQRLISRLLIKTDILSRGEEDKLKMLVM